MDYGPQFVSAGIVSIEPPHVGKPFPMLVPQVDADGNESAGIRMPDVAVPLATFTGWNLRAPEIGAPQELFSMAGSYLPFARTAAERAKTGDPRLSIAERYATRRSICRRSGPPPARSSIAATCWTATRPRKGTAAAEWDWSIGAR